MQNTKTQRSQDMKIHMNTEEYSATRKFILDDVKQISHKPIDVNVDCISTRMFHYIDMNLAHIGKFYESKTRLKLAEKTLTNILLTRNIDLVPRYISYFCNHIEVIDPAHSLESTSPLIFSGFHTGSYWSLISELMKRNKHLSFIFPKHLNHMENSVLESLQSMKEWHKSSSTIELLRTSTPNFLLAAKRGIRNGRSLILYVDANSNAATADDKRNIDFDFMKNIISIKESIFSLAKMLKTDMVSFNTHRENGMQRILTLGHPVTVTDEESSPSSAAKNIYADLASTLSQDPTQWEGWLYAHKLLKKHDASQTNPIEWETRFFVEEINNKKYLMDKSNMQAYPIRDKK